LSERGGHFGKLKGSGGSTDLTDGEENAVDVSRLFRPAGQELRRKGNERKRIIRRGKLIKQQQEGAAPLLNRASIQIGWRPAADLH